MNKKILLNLESKPYKLIICLLYEENSIENLLDNPELILKAKEYVGNKRTIIENKKLGNIDEFDDYIYDLSEKLNTEGYINASKFYNVDYINAINNKKNLRHEKVYFIEDEIGFLLKAEGSCSGIDLITTRYIEEFKKTIYFSLSTDNTFKNLDNGVRKSFKFFIENKYKIIEDLKLWYWNEWLFSEFYDDAMNYNLEKENRLQMMFDEGFDAYIKQDKIKKSSSFWDKDIDTYNDLKSESDSYFSLDSEIKNSKTKEDKIRVIDQILSISHIEIDNYEAREHSNIRFYFDYLLDDHGFGVKFIDHNDFEICT